MAALASKLGIGVPPKAAMMGRGGGDKRAGGNGKSGGKDLGSTWTRVDRSRRIARKRSHVHRRVRAIGARADDADADATIARGWCHALTSPLTAYRSVV